MLRIKPVLLLLTLTLFGCHKDVVNKEPVFDKFDSTDKEYKDKLAEKIKTDADISCYFNRLLKIDHKDYMEVSFEGDDYKAIGFVIIKDWKNLEGIKKAKGMVYGGAELNGLQVEIIPDSKGAILVYKDLDWIID